MISAAKLSTDAIPESSVQADTSSATSNATKFRFSNADTLSDKPSYLILGWQSTNYGDNNDNEEEDEDGAEGEGASELEKGAKDNEDKNGKEQDMDLPKQGETLGDEWWEQQKRDQDRRGIYMYNDWNGYGCSEVMENLLKDFNRDIYKKTLSPYEKWAYIEALAIFFKAGDLMEWMMQDDSDGLKEIINMMGTMVLTSLKMLSEHNLFIPDSQIKNIPIICLLILEFLNGHASDLDLSWQSEIVRHCDEADIKLVKTVRKQVSISKKSLEDWRSNYKEKMEDCEDAENEDGYKIWAKQKNWKPENDYHDTNERKWYRWDWKLEYKDFKQDHAGGHKYDLTKIPESEMNRLAGP
ncbi:hypothetical protein SBOR_8877 [Sclerotinia borealis F-4128]|uniref:SAP domain-containing protein n=1 Tax=Sclerotinia borealis (strain F-4128) TaxID=1432307 RepID=W9C4U6_SCLBF|nr:hypothetical protein SBOR_8877 [Sclerotinia borealis F-4128]